MLFKKKLPKLFNIKSETIDFLKFKLGLSSLEARTEYEILMENLFGFSSKDLELKILEEVNIEKVNKLKEILNLRLEGKPLAYINNTAHFFSLKFYVDENVLIPRPESETLIEIVIKNLKNKDNIKILEIGTGSGCLSITLLKFLGEKINKIIATDISQKALDIAYKNACTHKIQDKIEFIKADLVNQELEQQNFDFLISNPPYIASKNYDNLQKEVKQEPFEALCGSKENIDGKLYYKRIFDLNLKVKHLLFETDPEIIEDIANLFLMRYKEIKIHKDLNNLERFLECK